jgi:CRP-like cAMP-binding protein
VKPAEVRRALEEMQSLRGVSAQVVEWLAAHVQEVVISAGERFITEGESARDCFFLVTGEAQVTRGGVRLGTTGPGEPEGEVALFLRVPRTATTIALTDVHALLLRAEDYDELERGYPRLAVEFRVPLCRHLARRFGLQAFAGVTAEE